MGYDTKHQIKQIPLLTVDSDSNEDLVHKSFSHGNTCDDAARKRLESQYASLFDETERFNRQLVSFQANKTETLHSWIKYREGFSAQLVELLLLDFDVKPGQHILDPFAGSCTTLLEAEMFGVDATGIELLPHCHLAWEGKSQAFDYSLSELSMVRELVESKSPPKTKSKFPHLSITESAFPIESEVDLMSYSEWIKGLDISARSKTLCRMLLMSILEDISYTRKDGQYLRWDSRASKIQERNSKRIQQGKKPVVGIDKGDLPNVKGVFLSRLDKVITDITDLQKERPPKSSQYLIEGNTLLELPRIKAEQFHAVITSPPYANRYDYTRTYALELAYLGVEENIFSLRQQMLSCTVENRPKLDELERLYKSIGLENRFHDILSVADGNLALREINVALGIRNELGDINNSGVLKMVAQYFAEMTFVFAELFRVCKSGAKVAFVNDNVRYAGEIIPVDTLSTSLAEAVGFKALKICVLPQRKGNSSQQMGKFGRQPLRKSITIWEKP